MKKISTKKLVVAKQTIRSLQQDELKAVAGGGTLVHGYSCKCPGSAVCNPSFDGCGL